MPWDYLVKPEDFEIEDFEIEALCLYIEVFLTLSCTASERVG
jgi:hypothetical protein